MRGTSKLALMSCRGRVRRLYDYFGDKQTLLRAVVDAVGQSLITAIRRTLDDTLTHDTEAAELEDALVTFSLCIATDMLGSAECATLQRLVRAESGHLPHRGYNAMADAPDEAIAERFAAFAAAGLLDVAALRLAADQFLALTFGVALDRLGSANATEDSRVRPLINGGVRTFRRAYRTAYAGAARKKSAPRLHENLGRATFMCTATLPSTDSVIASWWRLSLTLVMR
ncbi:TetR/AcrR family transcriptional regulator C-terminal domain-containing protein [Streptomyces sp. S.PB5]|uniref:TetR/AcrR family transcriptional regulator C-terminal domain-containing protein n=1 Tax=Streptomyces sp. S.PB5 TaxID=3020844 RepID=UPI0025B05AC2|nr:TetR/AcrR family transcriptional regulator C-terminal domain-containing protein [Streptomyces sp. S.PB5]MDN3028421.1 TetR/AcrR family transcriptional regulator C-terminal domain-containing protein [Streptomyces sp. S.PB5]